MLMASFYSCRINKNNTEITNIEFEYLDIIIRNNSDTVYYFNKTDIENPACFVDYIDEYYHINLDETDFTVTKTLLGNALEKQFYMYCSKETFEYSSWFSDYSKKLQQYGEKIQGTMIGERNVLFELN